MGRRCRPTAVYVWKGGYCYGIHGYHTRRQCSAGNRHSLPGSVPDKIARTRSGCLLIIDGRALDRQCLASALSSRSLGMEVVALGSAEEWHKEKDTPRGIGRSPSQPRRAESERRRHSRRDHNARSQIQNSTCWSSWPTPTTLENPEGTGMRSPRLHPVVGRHRRLHRSDRAGPVGGIFVPASSVMNMRHLIAGSGQTGEPAHSGMFTSRQAEVALRSGAARRTRSSPTN